MNITNILNTDINASVDPRVTPNITKTELLEDILTLLCELTEKHLTPQELTDHQAILDMLGIKTPLLTPPLPTTAEPQGLFNVGLDESAQNSLDELAETVRQGIRLHPETQSIIDKISTSGIQVTPNLPSNVNAFIDSANVVSTLLGDLIAKIRQYFGTLSGFEYNSAVFVLLIAAVGMDRYADRSWSRVFLSIVMGLAVTSGSFVAGSLLLKLTSYINSTHAQPQVNVESVPAIAEAIVVAFIMFLAPTSNPTQAAKFVFSEAGLFTRKAASVQRFVMLILALFKRVVDFVSEHMFKCKPFVVLSSCDANVQKWLDMAQELEKKRFNDMFDLTEDNALLLKDVILQGEKLYIDLNRTPTTSNLCELIKAYLQQLTNLYTKFIDANLSDHGTRVEAVGVLLIGPTAQGKSMLCAEIAHNHLFNVTPPEWHSEVEKNPQAFIYNRNTNVDHWDAYTSKKRVCFFDELGQRVDVAGVQNSEFEELIKCINIFENMLRMADLANKGNQRFNCPLVIANSNMVDFNPQSIIAPKAVMRRFTIIAVAVLKPQYCKEGFEALYDREPDIAKFPKNEHGLSVKTPDMCEFYLQTYNDKTKKFDFTGTIWDWASLNDAIADALILKRQYHEQYQQQLKQTLAEAAKVERPWRIAQEAQPQSGVVQMTDIQSLYDQASECGLEHIPMADPLSSEVHDEFGDLSQINREFLSVQVKGAVEAWIKHRAVPSQSSYLPVLANWLEFKVDRTWPTRAVQKLVYELASNPFPKLLLNWLSANDWYLPLIVLLPTELSDLVSNQISQGLYSMVLDDYVGPRVSVDYSPGLFRAITKSYARMSSNFSDIPESERTWYSSLVNHTRFVVESFGPTLLTCLELLVAFKLLKFTGSQVIKFVPEWLSWKSTALPQYRPKTQPVKFDLKQLRQMAQAQTQAGGIRDIQNRDITDSVMSRNMYVIKFPDYAEDAGFATFIVDDIVMIPAHFVTILMNNVKEDPAYLEKQVRLTKLVSKVELFCSVADCFNIITPLDSETKESQDFALFRVPNAPTHRDIRPNFVSRAYLGKKTLVESCLILPNRKTGVGSVERWMCRSSLRQNLRSVDKEQGLEFIVKSYWAYDSPTERGDCGALNTVMDPTSGKMKILGIHVAGTPKDKIGMATVITQEDLAVDLQGEELISDTTEIESATPHMGPTFPDDRHAAVAKMPYIPHISTTHEKNKSPLYGVWGESKKDLSVLKIVNGVDPLEKAAKKYGLANVVLDPYVVDMAVEDTFDCMAANSLNDVERRVFTNKEAIVGLDDDPDFGSINRQSSNGYPLASAPRGKLEQKNKTWYFGKQDDFDLENERAQQLLQEVNEDMANLSLGKRVLVLYLDKLKDELRPLDKIESASTRMFSALSTKGSILFRRLFGAFLLWVRKNHTTNGVAVGINPYSTDWEGVLNYLAELDPTSLLRCGAGDFSGFDGRLSFQILKRIVKYINLWYGGSASESLARKTLWLELIQSRHFVKNEVVEWLGNMPSGVVPTAVVNSIYNLIQSRVMWAMAYKTPTAILYFREHVRVVAYGDDIVYTVSADAVGEFNDVFLALNYHKLGMVYTKEDKTIPTDPVRNIYDCTFLKRGWRFEPILGRHVAPLSLDTILETPYWVKGNNSQFSIAVRSNVDDSLEELALHEEAVYHCWAPKMIEGLRDKMGLVPSRTSRRQLLMRSAGKSEWYL